MWVWGCSGGWQHDPGAILEGEACHHIATALPLVRQDTPPCLSYLGLIQSLFYPTKSMALQGTAGAPGCTAALCTSLQISSCQKGRKEGRKERGFTAVPLIPGPGSHSALLCRSAWKANLKASREFLQAAWRHESHRPLPCSFLLSQSQGKHSLWFPHPQPHQHVGQALKTPLISEAESPFPPTPLSPAATPRRKVAPPAQE